MNRAWIEARIPHRGRMCLLDEVIAWNHNHLRCRTGTHRALDNPLRSYDRLGIACGIEYAAQAMALHGALARDGAGANAAGAHVASADAEAASRVGLLASVRDVRLHVSRLDDIESDLLCEVTHLAGDSLTAMYEFTLRDKNKSLLGGRATVVLDAAGRLRL
jgi:predicted hotdog family 3-hydroxylacyl-ACP dehydratase